MGLLDFLPIIGKIFDRILPDKAASEAAKLKVMELAQAGDLAELNADLQLAAGQLDIDKIEAASPKLFVSGWRPWLGWVCGTAFAIQYVVGPVGEWLSALAGHPTKFPTLDYGAMSPVLMGMLGLGGMRTYEKVKGVAAK